MIDNILSIIKCETFLSARFIPNGGSKPGLSHLLTTDFYRFIFHLIFLSFRTIYMLNISPKLDHHFKHFCSSSEVIMLFVYMKCRFSLSYRELEEMMMIRGAIIDHSTLQRWVKRFVCLIDQRVRKRK